VHKEGPLLLLEMWRVFSEMVLLRRERISTIFKR
jgi:hypothetical protein